MKKTRRTLSLVALLLAALMLFSSCAVNYRTVDPADYVQVSSEVYEQIKLAVNKMLVTDDNVTEQINRLRYENKKDVLGSNGKPIVSAPGAISAYDVLVLRTFLYDQSGNLVQHDFAVNTKATDTKTVSFFDGLTVPVGYGAGLNSNLLAKLEKALFTEASSPVLVESHLMKYDNVGSSEGADPYAIQSVPAVGFLQYTSSYKKGDKAGNLGKSSGTSALHFAVYADAESKVAKGQNSYEEAIYLGLKAYFEDAAKTGGKITPTREKDKTSLTVYVYPTASGVPAGKENSATAVHIAYDINMADTTKKSDYTEGEIAVQLEAAVMKENPGEGMGFFKTEYTFGSDEYESGDTNGEYTNPADEKNPLKKNGTKCTVYAYIEARMQYTCEEYNKSFILDTLKFVTDKTDEEEIKAAHRAALKAEMQKECDDAAKAEALNALWNAVLGSTESAKLIKIPKRNVKKFVKGYLDSYKYQYYDDYNQTDNVMQGADELGYKNSAGEYVYLYPTFENFVVASYNQGFGTTFTTQDAVENALWEKGVAASRENFLTYYLADVLGVRLSEDRLMEITRERGATWAKDRVADERKSMLEQIETQNKNATKAEDKVKLPNEYASYEQYVNALIPDDAYTWETYFEGYGEDVLFGKYQLDAVKEALYQKNLTAGNLTYTDQPYKAS